jgi:hypothetical protein
MEDFQKTLDDDLEKVEETDLEPNEEEEQLKQLQKNDYTDKSKSK